jgi:AAA15 family ATPase/GTPase
MMRISKIHIDTFRHLRNLDIPLDKSVIAIAGQNGTGKSTLLGLIGHVFTFPNEHKTLLGRHFATVYSEIFQFSYPDFDKPKEHNYTAHFSDNTEVKVQSTVRKEKSTTLRLAVGSKVKDDGKRRVPVIYLGLRRLYPLAHERTIRQDLSILSDAEAETYKALHNEILLLDDPVVPKKIVSRTKGFYAATTPFYDSTGISAGQDNIGQIISALLSFKRLKDSLGVRYKGGILLIDEIDATLYAAAQEKLIQKLFRYASDLSLQVIFTTHSLEVLELLDKTYKRDSEIVYLSNSRGTVQVKAGISIESIRSDIHVKAPLLAKIRKVDVYCEDDEARLFINSLLPPKTLKRISVLRISFGNSELRTLVEKKVPAFKKSIIVLDGDAKRTPRDPKNVVFLPGTSRPEDMFFQFLKGLPKADKFWGETGKYTKQVCFRDQGSIGDRGKMKNWFKNQRPSWGRNGALLFSRWKRDNSVELKEFIDKFELALGGIKV